MPSVRDDVYRMTRDAGQAAFDLGQADTRRLLLHGRRMDRCTDASRRRQRSLRPIEVIVTGPGGAFRDQE